MASTVQEMIEHPMLVKVPPAARLTARQVEILTLIACGKSNKEISVHLGISVKTVISHRAILYRALNVHEVATLTLYAIRERFVKVF